jgi:beta-lactamase class A
VSAFVDSRSVGLSPNKQKGHDYVHDPFALDSSPLKRVGPRRTTLGDWPGSTPPPETGDGRVLCAAEDLADLLADARGGWGLVVRDLSTGETLIANPGRRFVAGSLYKLGVAAEAYDRINDGTLGEQSLLEIGLQDIDPEYGGSRYSAGTYLTVHQAIVAMLTVSDNGAAWR